MCSHLSGQRNITGIVINDEKEPLEFATIFIQGNDCGTYSNSKGEFTLNCDSVKDSVFNIVVSYIGYDSKNLLISGNSELDTIYLMNTTYDLREVVISGSRNVETKIIKLKYKIKKPYFYYQKDINSTYEVASRIDNKRMVTGAIDEIEFIIGAAANGVSPLRIIFYGLDENKQIPSEVLNQTDIIVNLKRGKNIIKLEDYNINIPSTDFYISFEFVHSNEKKSENLDFSIGMIPYESKYPLLEKIGGSDWRRVEDCPKSRALTSIKLRTIK